MLSDTESSQADDIVVSEKNQNQIIPPDGGFRAWFHVFLGHIVFFNTWGISNSFGIFQQYYTLTLDSSPSSIAWIGSIQTFLLFFIGIFSGRASDAGYFRHCFVAGVILQVVGLLAASWSTTYWQILLSQGVCLGLGSGLLFTPGLSVTSSYFKTKRSVALGLMATGAATGGMVYPAAVNSLLNHTTVGYGWTMRALALILLATQITAMVGYRPYLPKRSVGSLIDMAALREKSFVFFTISMYLHFWGLYLAFFYLGIFARQTFHLDSSFDLIIILNGVGVIGRTAPNLIGERYVGIVNITIFLSVACALCVYCWPAIDSISGLYAWTVVYGLCAGGMQSLLPTLATQQAPESNKVGTWTGMILTTVSFACLTGPAIEGAVIQAEGGRYLGAQMFAASSIVLGGVFLCLSRWSKVGSSLWVKI